MYSNLPNLVIGFHGCDQTTFERVLYKHEVLLPSKNSYDWLGNGIYFWENSLSRAEQWAEAYCGRYNKKNPAKAQKKPAVIGAVISLGHCLNLSDYGSAEILKKGYELLEFEFGVLEKPLPQNRNVKDSADLLYRDLDCAVIERIHQFNRETERMNYDSVRGTFLEGKPVYPESGIMEKTHTQLCIINPNCIKGYFSPLMANRDYSIV